MAEYSTRMHGPSTSAPSVSNLVAHCKVCKCEWQVWGDPPVNTKGCSFCNAPESAITVTNEAPDYGYKYTAPDGGDI